ncbi:hypothetical protein HPB50_015985 [Hyalomma asiaticum]|uniref:Uncharacterized protein n=1 Tax=Hyalomma asiaticum TaxID=266040 RepID=A0ACB7RN02_HYAAI|nr:hypothetical protein HPB50_015985 [Hyalomma asiaticum]
MDDTSSSMPAVFLNDQSPRRDHSRNANTPPPPRVVCGELPPAESVPNAPVPVFCFRTHLPHGHPGWPPPAYTDDLRRFWSPRTLPGYCTPGMTTNRDGNDRFGHGGEPATRAPEPTHNHQPVIVMDTRNAPHPDADVKPLQYYMVGVLFAGLFAAAALVGVDSPGGHLSWHDTVHPEQDSPRSACDPRLTYGMDILGEGKNAGVILSGPEGHHSTGVQASAANGPFRKSYSSAATTTVVNDKDDARNAEPVDSTAPKRRLRQDCSPHCYAFCTRPWAIAFHYDPKEMACVSSTVIVTQLCNPGTNRICTWERRRVDYLQPDLITDM